MNADQFQQLLLHPSKLSNAAADELREFNRMYPWFGAGHFLLALKLKQAKKADAEKQLQKTFLYFQDPVWMNWQWKRFEDANGMSAVSEIEEMDELELQDEQDAVADAAATVEAYETLEAAAPEPPLPPLPQPVTDASTELTFEPLHTVDYFASQGIKLKEEKLGNDELSRQVKTFTQWLKTMKKVYAEENTQLDVKQEADVVQIARESNLQSEVVTETMAQVLVQQGKTEKAVEIYNKLSLLHPEKSAYFALLISELKS
jgi:tetratricopeptide (TPR) repeat protein